VDTKMVLKEGKVEAIENMEGPRGIAILFEII
jgi:hypothetical protein